MLPFEVFCVLKAPLKAAADLFVRLLPFVAAAAGDMTGDSGGVILRLLSNLRSFSDLENNKKTFFWVCPNKFYRGTLLGLFVNYVTQRGEGGLAWHYMVNVLDGYCAPFLTWRLKLTVNQTLVNNSGYRYTKNLIINLFSILSYNST